jgi:hypothetical protein
MKLIAVRYRDGRVVKGRTVDFKPGSETFHVRRDDGTNVPVQARELKAVFFIRSAEGDPGHEEKKDFGTRKTAEKRIWIRFTDGEELAGWSTSFASGKGFFFTPTDPDSNLERGYVYRDAVKSILEGAEADRAAAAHRPRPRSSAGPGGR